MSYSLYIPCKNETERDEILSLLNDKFKFPEENYKAYIGTDLAYIKDEFEKYHVGFQMNGGYLSDLVIICLSIIALKRNLKVYWDDTDLKIEDFDDYTLLCFENFISRNIRKVLKNDNISNWNKIKTYIFFKMLSHFEKQILKKEIITKCNLTIKTIKEC